MTDKDKDNYEDAFTLTLTQLTALKAVMAERQATEEKLKAVAIECGLVDPSMQVNFETGNVRRAKPVEPIPPNRATRRASRSKKEVRTNGNPEKTGRPRAAQRQRSDEVHGPELRAEHDGDGDPQDTRE